MLFVVVVVVVFAQESWSKHLSIKWLSCNIFADNTDNLQINAKEDLLELYLTKLIETAIHGITVLINALVSLYFDLGKSVLSLFF